VTKVKGCTGTYLWGPDELELMQRVGNWSADQIYGSEKVSPEASKAEKQRFVTDKYEKRRFAPANLSTPAAGGASVEPHKMVADSYQADPQACDAKLVRNAIVTSPPVNSTPSAALLTSVPRRSVAKKADIPDNLFEELFGDWTTPSPTKQDPAVEKLELPVDFFQDACGNDDTIAVGHVMPTQKAQRQAKPRLSTWGALGDVDDIFAELNKP